MGTMEWRLRCIMVERDMWELEILDQLYLNRGYNSRTELFKRT